MIQKLRIMWPKQRSTHFSIVIFVRYFPFVLLALMACSLLLINAILPLQGIGEYDALLSRLHTLGQQAFLPTHLLFPGLPIGFERAIAPLAWKSTNAISWKETALLFSAMLSIFLLYIMALRSLPVLVSRRFLFISTFLLGFTCLIMPIVTSSDIFSYIAYARIGVVYHQNPLTTWPASILSDPVMPYVYWVNQPSAYGPVWAGITSLLQWVAGGTGIGSVVRMVILLRLLGLAMHLGSTALVWHLGGQLQRLTGNISSNQRMRAALAFGWNPLLLFEACVNAHIDTTILFFILLGIWALLSKPVARVPSYILAIVVFALVAAIKLNFILLLPGLLLYVWYQSRRIAPVLASIAAYFGSIVLLYAAFWQPGLLDIIRINPASTRNINSLADFVNQFYSSIVHVRVYSLGRALYTSVSENATHIASIALFLILYSILCWRAFRRPGQVDSVPGLIRWMALVWLLYCAVGSPWFWPWYLVAFFGLFALLEALHGETSWSFSFFKLPAAVRLLAFSSFSFYCFYAWGPAHTAIFGDQGLLLTALRGLWIWLLPLLALRLPPRRAAEIPLKPFAPRDKSAEPSRPGA